MTFVRPGLGRGGSLGALLALCLAPPAGAQSAFRVKDINPTGSSNPMELTVVGGLFSSSTLYFAADDGVNGVELWKSNGTEVGTVLVEDINVGAASSSPANLTRVGGAFSTGRLFFTNVNGTLFLTAADLNSGGELWKSDGTAGGTVTVKDIRPGVAVGSSGSQLINVGGTLFFQAVYPGPTDSSTHYLSNYGSVAYFAVRDGVHGFELWRSDGRTGGTFLVRDIIAGPSEAAPYDMTVSAPFLFFTAGDGVAGRELWATDLLFKDGVEFGP